MHAKDTSSTSVGSILLSIAAVALAGAVGTVSLLQNVGELGPKVGDIITFDPARRAAVDDKPQINAAAAAAPSAGCVLDLRTMHAGGGSFIVEAMQPGDRAGFRVHWAGQRTSSIRDCGRSAELLLDQDDIEMLAMAAGGYGAEPRSMARPQRSRRPATATP